MSSKLTIRELDLYSRQTKLSNFSIKQQEHLKNARVAIIGLGGLGSNSAMLLTAMGVGQFRLIDRDVVELSNLPRSPLYHPSDLKKYKAEVAECRLKDLNPSVELEIHTKEFGRNNARSLLEDVDAVVDGLDRFVSRMLVNQYCKDLKIPFIFAGIVGTAANLSTFLYDEGPCLSCIFGVVKDSELPTSETVGVHTPAVVIAASIQASEAVRILTGLPPVLDGKILYIDLETLSFDQINIGRRENCDVCAASFAKRSIE